MPGRPAGYEGVMNQPLLAHRLLMIQTAYPYPSAGTDRELKSNVEKPALHIKQRKEGTLWMEEQAGPRH